MEASQATSITHGSTASDPTVAKPSNKVVLIPPSYFLNSHSPLPTSPHDAPKSKQNNPTIPFIIKPVPNHTPSPNKTPISLKRQPGKASSHAVDVGVPNGAVSPVPLPRVVSSQHPVSNSNLTPKVSSLPPSSSPMGLRMLLKAAKANVSISDSPQRGSIDNVEDKVAVPETMPSDAELSGKACISDKEESLPLEGKEEAAESENSSGVKLTKSAKKRLKKKAQLKAQEEEIFQELLQGSVGTPVPSNPELSVPSILATSQQKAVSFAADSNASLVVVNGPVSEAEGDTPDLKECDETAEAKRIETSTQAEADIKKAKKKKKKAKAKVETGETTCPSNPELSVPSILAISQQKAVSFAAGSNASLVVVNGPVSEAEGDTPDLKECDETAEAKRIETSTQAEADIKKAKKKKRKAKAKVEAGETTQQVPEVPAELVTGRLDSRESASADESPMTHTFRPLAQSAVHEVQSTPNLRAMDTFQYPNLVHCLPRSVSCSALLPPIGIFWDIENCQVPRSKSALDMVTVLRRRWENKYREVEFVVACDTLKEDACVLQELHHANVTVVHVFSISKNAADEKLRQLMRKFTETYEAPCAAILISSDINFAGDLHALKRAGVHVILYHNEMVSKALQMSSHETYAFPDLVKCVPNKTAVVPKQTGEVDLLAQSRSQLLVSNLPEKKVQLIKTRLNQLSDNCGGKFVCKIGEKAVLDFATPLAAARASKRMEGEDVFGSKIHCSKPFVSEIRRPPVGRVGTATHLLGAPYRYRNGPFPPPPNPLLLEPPKLRFPNLVGPPITPPRFAKPAPVRDAFKEAASFVDRPDYYRTPSEYLVETTPEGYRRIKGTHKVVQPERSSWGVPGVAPLDKETCFVNRERNTADGHSSSSSSCSSTSPPPNPVDLHVTNLDSAMEPRHLKKLLKNAFSEHVTVLHVAVQQQSDGSLSATVRVPSLHDAQCAVSMLHRKKLGFKRMMIAYSSPRTPSPQQLRSQVVSLLLEVPEHRLPLFKFREMYEKRFHLSVGIAELLRLRDTVLISEDANGRDIQLAPDYFSNQGWEMANAGLEDIRCEMHAPSHMGVEQGWAETEEEVELPNVFITLKELTQHVESLLYTHGGSLPLNTLAYCYAAEIGPLNTQDDGVPLEHLVSCLPKIEIAVMPSGAKKLQWAAPVAPETKGEELKSVSPALAPQIWLLCRELVDLLKVAPQGRIAFSRFIPAYHHHFGRQCRVADYGYTRLADLLEALPSVVQVLGQGSKRMIMLAHRAQVKRFTADLLRILKAQTNKQIALSALPSIYEKVMGKTFDPRAYGVCDLSDLLAAVSDVVVAENQENSEEMILALPKREQTLREKQRTKIFAAETVELLKHAPQCKMYFSKFIPSYHHHFGRQCRVSDYGFTKLMELFEAVPDTVQVIDSENEHDKFIQLTLKERFKVLTSQIEQLIKQQQRPFLPLYHLQEAFCKQFGFVLRHEHYGCRSLEDLLDHLRNSFTLIMDQPYPLVTLVDKSVLATKKRQIRRLLYDAPEGSMYLEDLHSTYADTYNQPCPDLDLDFDDLLLFENENGEEVVKLTPLQQCGRNVCLLLQERGGQISVTDLDNYYAERFGTDDGLAHGGCDSLAQALEYFTDFIVVKGKGQRRFACLSKDEANSVPLMSKSPHPSQVMELKPPAHWLTPDRRSDSPAPATPIADERMANSSPPSLYYSSLNSSIRSLLLGPGARNQGMYPPLAPPCSPWVWGFGFGYGGMPYPNLSSNYAYNYMMSAIPWWPPCTSMPCVHAATVEEIEDVPSEGNAFPLPPTPPRMDERERKDDKRRPRLAAQFDSSV